MSLENMQPMVNSFEKSNERKIGFVDNAMYRITNLFRRFGKGMKDNHEVTLDTKEVVVNKVDSVVKEIENIIDSGVLVTQEVYTDAKNKIVEAKKEVFSFIEELKVIWEEKIKEAADKKLKEAELETFNTLRAERQDAIAKGEAARAEAAKQDARFVATQSLIQTFKFSDKVSN